MIGITLILLSLSVATALIGGFMIDAGQDEGSPPITVVGCLMLASGLYASIYYAIALTQ